MASSMALAEPNAAIIWDNINAYQRTACLKGAVELGLFTRIGEEARTAEEIAAKCGASARGIRILCDYLTIQGLLTKGGAGYDLTLDSATFLDQRSPAYLGGTLTFLNDPALIGGFDNVAEVVRRGTTTLEGSGTVDPDDPIWVEFAQTGNGRRRTRPSRLLQMGDGSGWVQEAVVGRAGGWGSGVRGPGAGSAIGDRVAGT